MSLHGGRERLVVFARTPRLGRVKTRLSPPLSPQQTLELHRALVEDTLERLGRFRRPDLEHWLYLSEASPAGGLEVATPWLQSLQSGGDLGHRMENAFQEAFEQDLDRVVIVGSDSPTLPLDYLEQAYTALLSHDAVLGPADDGGYYLVGLSRLVPELLQGISWGSARVMEQSEQALSRAGRSFQVLPTWYDVDRASDLDRLAEELERLRVSGQDSPRRTTRAVSRFLKKGKIPS